MSITINTFTELKIELYNPDNELIGLITSELQLNDVRLQIKRQKLQDYVLVYKYNDVTYDTWIYEDGQLDGSQPDGLFDMHNKQLKELNKRNFNK